MLAISAISIFLLGPIADHQRFSRQGIATLFLVGNVGAYRYSGNYFSPNPNPLVHTWSLSVEEQIYIFLPLVLMVTLLHRRKIKKITAVAIGIMSAISLVSFLYPTILQALYSRSGIELPSQFSFYSPIDRIWQFLVGGGAFLLLGGSKNRSRKIPKGIHMLTAISLVMILFGPFQIDLKVSSLLASLFAVIVILFKSLDLLPDFLTKNLEWVGDRSYSIYLVHMPLLYIAKYSPVMQIGTGEKRIIQSVLAVLASISLGALSYSKIENRYRNLGKSNLSSLKSVLVSVSLSVAIPLALFVGMDVGVKRHYWGMDRNIAKPFAAEFLDPECSRISEIGPPCVYQNAGASKTVLLLGDSHAGNISQAVIDAAEKSNWNAVIWTHSGCHVQFQRSIKQDVSDNCIKINKQMRNWVLKFKPNSIIISQFVRSNTSQSDLKSALHILQSIVPDILLIENYPVFPDEKDFMVSRPIVMSAYQPPKSFKLAQMQVKDRAASNQLARWARTNGISTVDFHSLFCTKENCTRFIGSDWLYTDTDHLSVSGAALTIPKLSNYLKRL